jgi:hypothetical protein
MGWQVGDLLVVVPENERACGCVHRNHTAPDQLVVGRAYQFAGFAAPECRCASGRAVKLYGMRNRAPHIGYCQGRFRKIRPDEHEACEEEFVTLIKRSKQPAPAEVRHG